MKYTVTFQPHYGVGREFIGKHAKRNALAWVARTEMEPHANFGDRKAKATLRREAKGEQQQ